jgi:oligoendopeptidase F
MTAPPATRPLRDTWDLTQLYPDDQEWWADAARAESQLRGVASALTVPLEAHTLVAVLQDFNDAEAVASKVITYGNCRMDMDHEDPMATALGGRHQQIQTLSLEVKAAVAAAVSQLEGEVLTSWSAGEPELRPYQPLLARLCARDGATSSAAVASLQGLANLIYEAYARLISADRVGPLWADVQRGGRTQRQEAFERYFSAIRPDREVHAATLRSCVQAQVSINDLFGQDDAGAAAAAYEMPPDVIPALVATVRNYLPVYHRYLRAYRARLGVDELRPWDLFAPEPVGASGVDLPAALELIRAATAPLGEDHQRFIDLTVRNGLVDARPRPGKRGGSCTYGGGNSPPLVLVNFRGGWSDLTDLAHEIGHATHLWWSQHQPYCYQPTRLLGETAATLTEMLLARSVAQGALPVGSGGFVAHYGRLLTGRMFRQMMFAEFELWLYGQTRAGGDLSADALDARLLELYADYCGAEVADVALLAGEWMRIPHLYWNHELPLYPVAMAAAAGLVRHLDPLPPDAERPAAITRLLAAGSSAPAEELLALSGVRLPGTAPGHGDCVHEFMRDVEQIVVALEASTADEQRRPDNDTQQTND